MGKQLAFLSIAVGIGVAAFFFTREPQLAAPVAAAAAPAAAPSAPLPPKAEPASAPAPLPPITFQNGFCGDGEAESFTTHYTLGSLVAQLPPGDPLVPELQAVVRARTAHDPEAELEALRRARKLRPNDPALGLAIALLTRDSGALDEAIDGLSTYLATEPAPVLSRLRARLEVARDIQRDYAREERSNVTLLWAPETLSAAQAHDLLVEVDRSLEDAARLLNAPRRQRLTVVAYPSRSEVLAVTCAASWSIAVYDGTLRVVAGKDGVDLKTLRHETLHAQLSPLAPKAPKWFHEGVAQSFARQDARTRTWTLMVKNRTWLPFTSLSGSFQVFDGNDADLAYAQSYAMVEMMRDWGGDAAISTAIAAFQEGVDTPTALARACHRSEITGQDLLAYLERRVP